ncbi:hypothetical protein ACB094_07G163800 [Castanea mollissima]
MVVRSSTTWNKQERLQFLPSTTFSSWFRLLAATQLVASSTSYHKTQKSVIRQTASYADTATQIRIKKLMSFFYYIHLSLFSTLLNKSTSPPRLWTSQCCEMIFVALVI